jgi:hypothetical protein
VSFYHNTNLRWLIVFVISLTLPPPPPFQAHGVFSITFQNVQFKELPHVVSTQVHPPTIQLFLPYPLITICNFVFCSLYLINDPSPKKYVARHQLYRLTSYVEYILTPPAKPSRHHPAGHGGIIFQISSSFGQNPTVFTPAPLCKSQVRLLP